MEEDFPLAAVIPTTSQVHLEVRVRARLQNLANIHDLVLHTGHGDESLVSTIEVVNSHIQFAIERTAEISLLRHQTDLGAAHAAQKWLFETIKYQSRLDRSFFALLFRSMLKRDANQWTDLEFLYNFLTQVDYGDGKERLRIAFAVCLDGNFAHKYKHLSNHRRQNIYLVPLPDSTLSAPDTLYARFKVAHRAKYSKVDAFVCPVSLEHEIRTATMEEEKSCPICYESYLDFNKGSIYDLVSNYPVKIKFCGHVIGKSCLETWWDTPDEDPARHPQKTCPMCRTRISHRKAPNLPANLSGWIRHVSFAKAVRNTTGMDVKSCKTAIKGLMCDEVVLSELETDLGRLKNEEGTHGELMDKEKMKLTEMVLKCMLDDVKAEKKTWAIPNELWYRAREVWMDAENKGSSE